MNAIYMDKIAAFPVCDWSHDFWGQDKENYIEMVRGEVITAIFSWIFWFR
jgi:hypothetical protein